MLSVPSKIKIHVLFELQEIINDIFNCTSFSNFNPACDNTYVQLQQFCTMKICLIRISLFPSFLLSEKLLGKKNYIYIEYL